MTKCKYRILANELVIVAGVCVASKFLGLLVARNFYHAACPAWKQLLATAGTVDNFQAHLLLVFFNQLL